MHAIEGRKSLVEAVHERLVEAIADGSLAPCAPLTQEDVAARLDVSRQPVSHALALLKRQGLAVEQGRRGLVVAPLDADRIRDLYQVRALLDAAAARLAAQRLADGVPPRTVLTPLETALAEGAAALESGAVSGLIAADVAFHESLHAVSGNSAIPETARDMWPHFRRCMGAVLGRDEGPGRIWREHAAIVAAIAAGDPPRAESLARGHAERAGAAIHDRLIREQESAAPLGDAA